MNLSRTKAALAAALVGTFIVATAAASPAAGPRAPRLIAANAVSGLRPLAAQTAKVGLDLYIPPRNAAVLSAFIAASSSPRSATYGRYLAKGQFASRFGAPSAELASIQRYLSGHGVTPMGVSSDHLFVRARGSIPAVDRLLHTTIREYSDKGKVVYSNVTPAHLPAQLAGKVATVVGLSDVPRFTSSLALGRHVAHDATTCSQMTQGTNATKGPFTISEAGDAYHYDAFSTAGDLGQGQTLGILELTNYLPADLRYFQDCTGVKQDVVNSIMVDGGGQINLSAEVEADLDIEIPATLAPKATLDVYQAPNAPVGVVDAYHRMAVDDAAQVVTTSWGLCEVIDAATVTAEGGVFAEMAAQGQTVVAAAGDSGASDCAGYKGTVANPFGNAIGVDDPASQPYVTGVGGTTVSDVATIGSDPTSETVWDSKDLEASGGGISKVWPQPAYQAGVAGASSAGRSVPDLSINADPASGYMIYSVGYGWLPIGGTSAGAPMIATLLLLANEANAIHLGFVNPLLYSVGVAHPGVNFNDVTVGNNETYDLPGYSSAAAGFDAPSGWGSPIASSFIGGDI